ncbi:MAG: NAD kinase [Crocinitomicaceae bacterium]|jgi:NAD+ kinase|nr:NAD kinase [Crocinitomicaceae bacterium]
MKVALYGRKLTRQNVSLFEQIFAILKDFNWTPILEKELQEQLVKKGNIGGDYEIFTDHRDLKTGVDMAFSIGGDGTFIKTVGYIRDSGVPIVGINTGRLGFLANISPEKIEETMAMVQEKRYSYQKRSMLRIQTEDNLFGEDNLALNELTLHKKDTSSMITVHASLDGNYLNSYWADGLIVGTPTGSTAYNLSCGGPIVTPGCQIHILTPIAPHNLNVRPMVVPDHMPINLRVEGRERRYLISLDSNTKSIPQDSEVVVEKAEFMINVMKFEDSNFLDTIRNKMSWGMDKRN